MQTKLYYHKIRNLFLHITKKSRHSLEYAVQAQESELYYNPGKQSKLKVAKPFLMDGKLGEHYDEKLTPQRSIKERIS